LPASPDLTQPAAVGVDAAKSSAASYGAPAGEARIVLKADSDSWIQVRDKSGSLLFTRVLKPGESYNVPNQPGLVLTAGNSGGLEVTVDGASAPPLGQPGKVARNVSLDPDRLLAADHLPAKTEHAN
jgi:cytoskeleton protein RodZ